MEILDLETCIWLSNCYSFNESCDKHYHVIGDADNPRQCRLANEDEDYWVCCAPTIGQMLKWLREKHDIQVSVTFADGKWGWDAYVKEAEEPHDYQLVNGIKPNLDTYEEAATDAIIEMIEMKVY